MKQKKCQCRFGSLGPAGFGFCQRCGNRHDGGNGAAGAKFDAWVRENGRMKWGLFCSGAEAHGVTDPRYKAETRAKARALVTTADRECQS